MNKIFTKLPEEFSAIGGVFSAFRDEIDNSFFRRISGARPLVLPNRLRDMIRFSTDLSLNACVERDKKGPPSYTFNLGACLGLADATFTLATKSEFVPEITFPKENVIVHHGVSPKTRYYDYQYIMENGRVQFWPFSHTLEKPHSTRRGSLGDHIFELATKFLSLHEQSHFMMGHLHFVANYLGDRGIDEAWLEINNERRHDGLHFETRRALELQADSFAAYWLFNAAERRLTLAPQGLRLPETSEPEEWQHFVLLAIALVVGILDRAERGSAKRSHEVTHPSAAARMLSIFRALQHWRPSWARNLTRAQKWQQRLLQNCTIMFEVLECAPLQPQSFDEFLDPTCKSYKAPESKECQSCLDHLEELLPRLQHFRTRAWGEYVNILGA